MVLDFETERDARVLVRFETKEEIQAKLEKTRRQLETKPPLWIAELFEQDKRVLEKALSILDK